MSALRARRQGFAGQHMVVVPDPVRRAVAEHPLLRGLLVTDAGYFPHATGHRVERPQGASTNVIIACLLGGGWVRLRGRREEMSPGDIVWLPADVAHSYGAAEEDPWTIVWAHFRGAEVPAWQRLLAWAEKVPVGKSRLPPERLGELRLDQVYAYLERGYSVPHLLGASAALRASWCAALDLARGSDAAHSAAERTAVVREQLIATSERHYRLSELATAAGVSVPHFCQLFRKQTGYPPIDFLIRRRIQRACRLLDGTHESVARIAAEVGFDDPYYFSRCFRRIMGRSPRSYRNIVKG
jgi:AraC family transcriptional regulator, arabinose operon regulatory protein